MKNPLSILPKISGVMICPSAACEVRMTSVGFRGGVSGPPSCEPSIFAGLANPLLDGDNGTPLTVPEVDGDLEIPSALRKCGVALAYKSRVLIGDCGCGKAGEREGGAIPGEE